MSNLSYKQAARQDTTVMQSTFPFIFHLKEICRQYLEEGTIPSIEEKKAPVRRKHGRNLEPKYSTSAEKKHKVSSAGRGTVRSCGKFQPVLCCGRVFTVGVELKRHQRTLRHLNNGCSDQSTPSDPVMGLVECCGALFNRGRLFKSHLKSFKHKSHTTCFPTTCCNVVWKSKLFYQKHLETQHCFLTPENSEEAESNFAQGNWSICCGVLFTNRAILRRHYTTLLHEIHSTALPTECCGVRWSLMSLYLRHRQSDHTFFPGSKYVTPAGPEMINKRMKYQPVMCCGIVFTMRSTLEKHQRTLKHTTKGSLEQPTPCSYLVPNLAECCGEFYLREKLEVHKKSVKHMSHTTCLPTTCCNVVWKSKLFYQKHLFTQHRFMTPENSEEAERNFAKGNWNICCGVLFTGTCLLRVHRRSLQHEIYSTALPTVCCGVSWSSMLLYRRHRTSDHTFFP